MSDKYVNAAGVQAIKSYVDAQAYTPPSVRTDGYWQYKIYGDNTFEAWYNRTGMPFNIQYASGNFYRSDPVTFTLPTDLQSGTVLNVQAQIFHANFPVFGAVSSLTPVKVQALSGANRGSQSCNVVIYVFGTV